METNDIIGIIQASLAFLAIVITIGTFIYQIKQRRKEAATVLFLQLEEMKENVTYVSNAIISHSSFDTEKMWHAPKIFIDNAWERYQKILVGKLDREDIIVINKFYQNTETINRQIVAVQDTIHAINSDFYIKTKMCKKLSQNIKPAIRVNAMYASILYDCCNSCSEFYKALPMRKLRKIAKMKF